MIVDGMPVCEICHVFFTGPYEVGFDGSTFHWSCLYTCHDCGREFLEGQSKIKDDQDRWVHERDEECIPIPLTEPPTPQLTDDILNRFVNALWSCCMAPAQREEGKPCFCPACQLRRIWFRVLDEYDYAIPRVVIDDLESRLLAHPEHAEALLQKAHTYFTCEVCSMPLSSPLQRYEDGWVHTQCLDKGDER